MIKISTAIKNYSEIEFLPFTNLIQINKQSRWKVISKNTYDLSMNLIRAKLIIYRIWK